MNQIFKEADQIKDELILHRRYLHKNPEVGFDTHNTEKYITEFLNSQKIEIIPSNIGVMGMIKCSGNSDIIALRTAVDNVLMDRNVLERHRKIGKGVRKAVLNAGLSLYIKSGYSNTVSVIEVPDGMDEKKLRQYMVDNFNVMIAGSFGYLQGKVLRIGHMGENARKGRVAYTLYSLQKALEHFGFRCKCDMAQCFLSEQV